MRCRVPITISNARVWHPKIWTCSGETEPSQPLRCVKVKEMPRRWGRTDGRERELRVWAITLLFRSPSFLALLELLLAPKHRLAWPWNVMAAGKACPLFCGCAVGDKSTQKVLESEELSKPECAQTMTWPSLPLLHGAGRGAVVCERLPERWIPLVHSSKIH